MRCSKYLASLTLLTATLAQVPLAAATCMVCDDLVEFDQPRALCFTSNYESYLDAARKSPTRAAEVDLTACAGGSGDESRGLERMRALFPPEKPADNVADQSLRSVYILDEAGIICLRRLIESYEGAFDPARFDLYEGCRQ